MNFLIISYHEDPHATLVAAALHAEGHRVTLWDTPAHSAARSVAVELDADGFAWRIDGRRYAHDHFDMIWPRRRRDVPVTVPLHEADKAFAQGESDTFFDTLFAIAHPSTRIVHPRSVAREGENKLLQLAIATRLGFDIPPSLVGNDREAILSFIARAESDGARVVYKTFLPVGWQEDDRVRMKHTSVIACEDIERNALVEAVPGIYQRRIAKRHELRATFFGERELTVMIDSQRHPSGREDWRSAINLTGYLSVATLPDSVRERCLAMMKEMSLSIACFDFIVDEGGHCWFLELNQQGQFLWVEEQCPDAPMLDAFIDFLLDGRKRYTHVLADALVSPAYRYLNEVFEHERFVDIDPDMALPGPAPVVGLRDRDPA